MCEENKQRLKEYQKNYREAKKSTEFFYFPFFILYKMERKISTVDKEFHKQKTPKGIYKVDTKGIV